MEGKRVKDSSVMMAEHMKGHLTHQLEKKDGHR